MISVHPIAGKELGQQVIAQAMAKQAEAPKSDKSEKKKAKQEPMGSKGRHISRIHEWQNENHGTCLG